MGVYASSKAIAVYQKEILSYLRDNKPNINDPNKWDLPGIDLNDNETYQQAMERAFLEQFNIKPANIRLLGMLKSNGVEHAVFLIVLDDTEVSNIHLGNRGQRFDFFSLDDLVKVGLTKPLLFYFQAHLNKLAILISGGVVNKEDLGLD